MAIDLAAILTALEQIVKLEGQVATAVNSEADMACRAKLLKACKDRDLVTIREMLFEVK